MHTTTGPTSRCSLTTVANGLARVLAEMNRAWEVDTQFDGGEFSGPAIARRARVSAELVLEIYGWTADEFAVELAARTSPRWAYLSGLTDLIPAEDTADDFPAYASF